MKNTKTVFKKALSIGLVLLMMFTSVIAAGAAGKADKVSVEVLSNGAAVLSGKVYDDYSAEISVPKGAVVNAGEVTGKISMTNIATLGIKDTKSYSKTITTGVDKLVNLDNYLPSFTSATVSGTIDGRPYAYTLTGVDNAEKFAITAVPQDVELTRTAWARLTTHVTTTTQAKDDSFAVIPGTAYVQIGTEKLVFENTASSIKIDNVVQGSGITTAIRKAVKLVEAKEMEDAQAEIFLPAGTILAVGQSVATLKDNVRIKMYGYKDSADVNNIMSAIRDCANTEEIIKTMVLFVSDFASAIDGQDLTVNIDFEKAPVAVSSVTLSDKEISLIIGESYTIDAVVAPQDASVQTITWTSSDEKIATVDENGTVTAVGKGEAVITATAANGVKAECKVVTEVPYKGFVELFFDALTGWMTGAVSIVVVITAFINMIFGFFVK